MWKSIAFGIVLVGCLVLHGEGAFAKSVRVPIGGDNWSVGRIQGICQKQGGDFYQSGGDYGCSKECKGGTCTVSCTGGHCSGTVPVPRLAAGGKYRVPVRPRGILSGVR
jgi:hypothetical protein